MFYTAVRSSLEHAFDLNGFISNNSFIILYCLIVHLTTWSLSCVVPGQNRPPTARAGGNVVVTLPVDFVRVDGSQSSDDVGIVSYTWTRDKSSPAAGVNFPISYLFTYF